MRWTIAWRERVRQMLCLSLGLAFCFISEAAAQSLTHKVEKGDTLWSISKKYYGHPDMWTKLWEMNPFVTNPHLLQPGDVIRLTTPQPETPKASVVVPPSVVQAPVEATEPPVTGIPVGLLTTLSARGFLSPAEAKPWGFVHSSDSEKIFLTNRDQLFVDFGEREGIKAGEEFMVFRLLSSVTNVITKKKAGYLYSCRAKILLRERTTGNIYRAEIKEGYSDVMIGDILFPVHPVPSCLKPLPADPSLHGNVVAVEGLHESFGRNSVVFLDSGKNKGLYQGSLLELVRFKNVAIPTVPRDQAKTITEMMEKRESTIFEKTVGRMVVLESGPETATALVLSSSENLGLGAFFRGVTWADPPKALRSILSCRVE